MEFKIHVDILPAEIVKTLSRKLDHVLDHLHAQSLVLTRIAAAVDHSDDQELLAAAASLKAKSEELAATLAASP